MTKTIILPTETKFSLGAIVHTPAVEAYTDAELTACLARHAAGDWGDICAEDAATNETALLDGDRVLSVYNYDGREPLWFITEGWDERVTTILLPSDY